MRVLVPMECAGLVSLLMRHATTTTTRLVVMVMVMVMVLLLRATHGG